LSAHGHGATQHPNNADSRSPACHRCRAPCLRNRACETASQARTRNTRISTDSRIRLRTDGMRPPDRQPANPGIPVRRQAVVRHIRRNHAISSRWSARTIAAVQTTAMFDSGNNSRLVIPRIGFSSARSIRRIPPETRAESHRCNRLHSALPAPAQFFRRRLVMPGRRTPLPSIPSPHE
jgi:hypothetical protein